MKGQIKLTVIVIAVLIFLFSLPIITEARSGCCSHHGGVCGCGCCDGTSLSATCAPYYPECSSPPPPRIYCGDNSCNGSEMCSSCPHDCGVCPIQQSPKTNTGNTNSLNQNSGVVAGAGTKKGSSDNWIWWVLGVLSVGIVAYKIGKKKSNK
jgi:hypothetical protein